MLLFLTRLTNREEGLWVLLGNSNNICYFQKVSFMDESEAIHTSSSAIFWTIESKRQAKNKEVREGWKPVKISYEETL